MEMPKPAQSPIGADPALQSCPLKSGPTFALQIIGVSLSVIGVIAGAVVLLSAPDGPSYAITESDRIRQAARTTYLFWGWSLILSSVLFGLSAYVIAGIGYVAIELWEKLVKKE